MQAFMEQGCPRDRTGEISYTWSGADISPSQFLTAGYERIVAILDDPTVDGRPKTEIMRCEACGNIWKISYTWPDHPPMALEAHLVPPEEREALFAEIGEDLFKTYGENVVRM